MTGDFAAPESSPEAEEECFEPPAEAAEDFAPPVPFVDTVAFITPNNREKARAKRELNPDTIGWLYISDTNIDSVILKNPPELMDNQYYLDVNFERAPDKNGTFCADFRSQFGEGVRNDLSRITTIFGHSWSDNQNGVLFEQLKKYRDPEFARSHPYVFFSTGEEDMAFEVFAVFDTTIDLPYIDPGLSDDEFVDMLSVVDRLSLYNYQTAPDLGDKILTLSTCTYSVAGHSRLPGLNNYRFAIMAKLASPEERAAKEAVFAINSPAIPDSVPDLMALWRDYTFPIVLR